MPDLTLTALVAAMAEAIGASDEIVAQCLSLYSTAPTVHVGASGYQAPETSEFPAFTVLGWSKDKSETEMRRSYDLTVGLVLHDETVSTETSVDGVVTKTYRGAATLETLLDLAMTAIRDISEEIFFDQKTMDLEPIEFFPLFVGELNLTVGFDALIGGAEPSL